MNLTVTLLKRNLYTNNEINAFLKIQTLQRLTHNTILYRTLYVYYVYVQVYKYCIRVEIVIIKLAFYINYIFMYVIVPVKKYFYTNVYNNFKLAIS